MSPCVQDYVYDTIGQQIKADLLSGNPVVLFAYGLSGSGKTFTVFGPDAPDLPEAWYKHAVPHKTWGIFPRLAYELFKDKKDGKCKWSHILCICTSLARHVSLACYAIIMQ
jgi:Kinesin motor domain